MSFPSPSAYFCILGLITVGRLMEMYTSKKNLACGSSSTPSNESCADPRGNWPAMVILHAALLIAPVIEVLVKGEVASAGVWWSCLVLLILAQGLRFASIRSLGEAWNARAILLPEHEMVSSGPYRWVRHPNYLAVLIEIIAIPAMGGAWISLSLLVIPHVIVLTRRISGEERLLARSSTWRSSMSNKGCLLPRFVSGGASATSDSNSKEMRA